MCSSAWRRGPTPGRRAMALTDIRRHREGRVNKGRNSEMDTFGNVRIKWPYVTHLIHRRAVSRLLPPVEETNPGSIVLARVQTIGKHRELEARDGQRVTLFAGYVFVCVLGNRYATDQYEGLARCSATQGHILGIGGVCGEVVSMNNRMPEPTVIEWLGRLAGLDGEPLHLGRFQ